jgi:hypothetical protein
MSRTKPIQFTEKQRVAIENYSNPKSPTFGNKLRSYLAAGYKNGSNAAQAACRLYNSEKVKAEIERRRENRAKRCEITEDYVRQQWQNLLEDCKDETGKYIDRTNANTVLISMAKSLSMLTDRVIDRTEIIHLEEHERQEAKKIASILINSHYLDDTNITPLPLPQPIDTDFIPIDRDNGQTEED